MSASANTYNIAMDDEGNVRLTFLDNRPDLRPGYLGNTKSDVVAEVVIDHSLFGKLMDSCEQVLGQHEARIAGKAN